jgi:MFS family permease
VTITNPPPAALLATTPFLAFRARHFGLVWLSGLIWHLCRWGVAFLGTYLINDLTGSPRLVQLAGTTLYAPLLIGGVIGGVLSDRIDRLATVRIQMAAMVPITVLIGMLVRSGHIAVWMLYIYMFIVGFGWVSDMTSRRALVFDLVGDALLDKAMAMEAMSLAMGMVFGALVGGYAVDSVGIGAAYFAIAGFAFLAILVLMPVTSPVPRAVREKTPSDGPTVRDLIRHRGLISILGVTVIANFFLFAYFPIIPVIAEDLDASPFQVGLLAGGTGIGMMTGSLVMARMTPRHRGLAYLAGLVVAFGFLMLFAIGTNYWFVFAAIVASGVGSGVFGATQSTLVVAAVPEEARGKALGLLSMAIGGLPLGMYVLGEVAEATSPSTALLINAVGGVAVLGAWVMLRPEVASMTDEQYTQLGCEKPESSQVPV